MPAVGPNAEKDSSHHIAWRTLAEAMNASLTGAVGPEQSLQSQCLHFVVTWQALRKCPEAAKDLDQWSVVALLDCADGLYEWAIRLADKKEGWVPRAALQPLPEQDAGLHVGESIAVCSIGVWGKIQKRVIECP